MNFNLSINKNIIDKGKVSSNGWQNAIMDAKQLALHVHDGFAFSPGSIRNPIKDNPKPKSDDIDFAQLVCVDIDNVNLATKQIIDPHLYWSYDNIINDNFVRNNALLVYSSPSHKDEWNKVRVVFLMDRKVKNKEEYKEICLTLVNYFGAAADKSINNIDRLFFGSTNCKYDVLENVLHSHTLDEMKVQSNSKADKLTQFNKDYSTNKFDDDKYTLTVDDVKELLSYINGDTLSRNEWLSIYAGVLNHFGFNTALSILDGWSPDVKKGTDVILNSIAKDSKIKSSIGTVIYHAKDHGCDYKDFIRQRTQIDKPKLTRNSERFKNAAKSMPNEFSDEDDEDIETNANSHSNSKKKSKKSKEYNGQHLGVKEMLEYIENYLNENYNLRYNTIKHCFEYYLLNSENQEWLQFNDRAFNSIQRKFMEQGKKIPVNTLRSIVESEFVPEHNPFTDYFCNLEKVKPTPYHVPDMSDDQGRLIVFDDYIEYIAYRVPVPEHQRVLWLKTFRRWLVGAVATAICHKGNSRNDLCPILSGGQGVGKTTFTRLLTPPTLKEYSGQVSIRPNNKDGTLAITEMFIIIMDEIESFDKNEQEHLKAIITTEYVKERLPYARQKEHMRRTASFIGSINRTEFLSDMTGSRRFPTFQITGKIDTYTDIDYDRLYGEVMYLLDNNFKYWVPYEEIQEIEANNQMFSAINQEEELLLQYVVPSNKDTPGAKFQTTTDIKLWLEKKAETRLNPRTLGLALRKKQFIQESKKINGNPFKGYWVEYLTDTINYDKETSKF